MNVIKTSLVLLIRLLNALILIRVLLSFFPDLRNSKLAYFVYQLTEPILGPCRALLDKLGLGMGMLDFSPILAYMLLNLVHTLVNML